MVSSWERRGGEQVPGPVGDSARLLLAGDTHGGLGFIGTVCKVAAVHGCQGVVQLGDFGFWADQRVWRNEQRTVINDRWLDAVASRAASHGVWWRVLDGNHDAHPLARAAYPAGGNGVRAIRSGVLDWADRGSIWEWCGRRFAALGGAVSIDRAWRREGVSWWATEEITDSEVDALVERAGGKSVDVLFSHDAPALPDEFRELSDPVLAAKCRRSNEQVMRAVDALQPGTVIHGHYHHAYRAAIRRSAGFVDIVGLASDQESHRGYGHAYQIMELPTLRLVEPAEL